MYDGTQQEDTNNVDKIRDILFGGQMRDYDRRFSQLEQRLLDDTKRLRLEYEQRLMVIEQNFQREVERIHHRATLERQNNLDAQTKLNQSIQQVEQLVVDENTDMRTQMSKQSATWADNLHTRSQELQRNIDRETAQLHDVKTSREDLAALFMEVALRLNRQLELPTG